MTIRNLFQNQLPRLQRQKWGKRIQGQDTGVNDFAEEILAILGAEEPIVLDAPIKITRNYDGPVFEVVDAAGNSNAPAVPASPGTPNANTALDATINAPATVTFNVPGTETIADMPNPLAVITGEDNSLFQPPLVLIEPTVATTAGGVEFPPVSIQASELPQTIINNVTQVVGQQDPIGTDSLQNERVVRARIIEIGDDTITVDRANIVISYGIVTPTGISYLPSPNIVALKPGYLRRSTFDGKTINGLSYTYSGSQTREVTDGETTETQVVLPAYVVGDEVLLILGDDFSQAVVADGDLRIYSDLNVDARQWATQ